MADRNTNTAPADGDEDIFAVRVRVTPEQAAELIGSGAYDFGDRPHVTENPDGTGMLDLFVDGRQIDALRSQGLDVQVESNQSARARERLSEVGQGDRFEGGKIPPRGLGRKIGREGPDGERGR